MTNLSKEFERMLTQVYTEGYVAGLESIKKAMEKTGIDRITMTKELIDKGIEVFLTQRKGGK